MTILTWVGSVGIISGICAILALKRFADSRMFFVRVVRSRFFSDECKEYVIALRSLSLSPLCLIFLVYAIWTAGNNKNQKLGIKMDSKEYKICISAFFRALGVNATAYMPFYFIVIIVLGIRFVIHIVRQQTSSIENIISTTNSLDFMNTPFARKHRWL